MEQHSLLDVHADGGELPTRAPDTGFHPVPDLSPRLVDPGNFQSDIQKTMDRTPDPARIPGEALQAIHREKHPLPRPMPGGQPPSIHRIDVHPFIAEQSFSHEKLPRPRAAAQRDDRSHL